MGWMDQIGGLVQQYAGGQTGGNAHADFDQVAQHAPKDVLAQGIAGALKSDQTPPLGQVATQLFSQGDSQQKAGILNSILKAIGPAILPQVLNQLGLGQYASLLGGGQVSPQQAEQVPPDAVGKIAQHAEQNHPDVANELGGFLSGHPDLVKSLGGGALSSVLSHLGQ